MRWPKRHVLGGAVRVGAATLPTQFALGRKKTNPADATSMDAQKHAVHALNRLTYGPRPGDVERVTQIGVDKWIDLQLHPDKIDYSALAARLAPCRTLSMWTKEIVENFPPEQLIKQIADGKASMPRDPTERAVYAAQLQRYENKQERKQDAVKSGPQNTSEVAIASDGTASGGKDDAGAPAAPAP